MIQTTIPISLFLLILIFTFHQVKSPVPAHKFNPLTAHHPTQYVILQIAQHDPYQLIGEIIIHLFGNDMPKSVENFVTICRGHFVSKETEKILSYNNVPIHAIFPDFLILTGDITNGDGSGGESIYGPYFRTEKPQIGAEQYTVGYSYDNSDNINNRFQNSQFFIVTSEHSYLLFDHNIFGIIIGIDQQVFLDQDSRKVVQYLQTLGNSDGEVSRQVYIEKCIVPKTDL